jgi:hypothetical protein
MRKRLFFCISIFVLPFSFLFFAEDIFARLITDKNELASMHSFMAELIVNEFRLYPYLADSLITEEEELMEQLLKSNNRAVAMLYASGKPIGFISGIPLADYFPYSFLPSSFGYMPESFYYLSDIILIPEYQKKGLVRKALALIEDYACSKSYAFICLACESHEKHPLKPANYSELGERWLSLGYLLTGCSEICYWKTLTDQGGSLIKEHKLDYWLKKL